MSPAPTAPPQAAPQVLSFGEALVDRIFPPGIDPLQSPGLDPLRTEGKTHEGKTQQDGADGSAQDHLGGAPANVACALARLGTASAFIGRLGDDAIGAAFRDLFAQRGVDTSALQWDAEHPSRVVLVRRSADGDRSFVGFAAEGGQGFADQAVDGDQLAGRSGPLLAAARWLLVGTIPLASPAAAASLGMLMERAKERGVALAVDVNWRPTFWGFGPQQGPPPLVLHRIRALLEQAALIKCAAEEAEWLFGETDPLAIHAALPQRPALLITDGDRPLRWCLGGRSGSLDAFAVPVVDTTGAGDAFTAGLLDGLCRRPELIRGDGSSGGSSGGGAADPVAVQQLMRFASACGALVCGGAGAIAPQPTRAEVEAFLRRQSGGG